MRGRTRPGDPSGSISAVLFYEVAETDWRQNSLQPRHVRHDTSLAIHRSEDGSFSVAAETDWSFPTRTPPILLSDLVIFRCGTRGPINFP